MKPVAPIDVAIQQLRDHIRQSKAVLADMVAARDKTLRRRKARSRGVVRLAHPVTGEIVEVKMVRR